LCLFGVTFNSFENIFKWPRHNTFFNRVLLNTSHSMCFTCTSLSISKNGSIVSLQYIFNNVGCTSIVNVLLGNCPIKDHIECELLWTFILFFLKKDFTSLSIHVNTYCVTLLHFLGTKWTASNNTLDCFCRFIIG